MKIFLLLLISTTFSFAQSGTPSRLQTRIADDGTTLSIHIDGMRRGQKVYLARTFPVAGMSQLRKELLAYRTFRAADVTPPLRELPGLLLTALGVVLLGSVLLAVSFRGIKAARMNPVKSLRSE
jgi:hypothetical protein